MFRIFFFFFLLSLLLIVPHRFHGWISGLSPNLQRAHIISTVWKGSNVTGSTKRSFQEAKSCRNESSGFLTLNLTCLVLRNQNDMKQDDVQCLQEAWQGKLPLKSLFFCKAASLFWSINWSKQSSFILQSFLQSQTQGSTGPYDTLAWSQSCSQSLGFRAPHTWTLPTVNINLFSLSQANCFSSLETNQRLALSAAAISAPTSS